MFEYKSSKRPSYTGNRPSRNYDGKQPFYKQPIAWIIAAALIALIVFVIVIFANNNNNTVIENPDITPNVQASLEPGATETPEPTATPDPDSTPAPTAEPTPAPTVNEGPLVWDTPNGKQFHFDKTCKGMNNASQETMMAAYNRGLQPCERCVTSDSAVAARPAIKLRALSGLPSSLGNVAIQDPQAFDIINVVAAFGVFEEQDENGNPISTTAPVDINGNQTNSGPRIFGVNGTTSGSISLLYTNQPEEYNIRICALVTDANGSIVWQVDKAPEVTLAGFEMPRDFSLFKELNRENVTGLKLTVLVYSTDGFEGIEDVDMAVLGMYEKILD